MARRIDEDATAESEGERGGAIWVHHAWGPPRLVHQTDIGSRSHSGLDRSAEATRGAHRPGCGRRDAVLLSHLGVAFEAAGREEDAISGADAGRAVGRVDLHAAYGSVIVHDE